MKSIRFEPQGVVTKIGPEETLLDIARRAGVMIYATCGGVGRCGRCQVKIDGSSSLPENQKDQEQFSREELADGWRLACQLVPGRSLVVQVPHLHFDGLFKSSLGVAETLEGVALKPAVTRLRLQLAPATLEDNRSDAARLFSELSTAEREVDRMAVSALRQLPGALRQAGGRVEVWIRGEEVIAVYPTTSAPEGPYGLAFDLGTTTVAAYLVNLNDGTLVGISSAANTQAEYGADVMTRIDQAGKGNLPLLQARIVQVMNGLAVRLIEEAGLETAAIADITAVGNTCMLHLLMGVLPTHLGLAPYVPAFTHRVTIMARDLGLQAHNEAQLTILPGIGGFVGADTVGAILAAEQDRSEKIMLMLDIGTNAEIVLGSSHGLTACATAAGPAFEGACITHGVPASPGAIDRVWWQKEKPTIHTIGESQARGLAGSGLVSAAAALRQAGLLNSSGLLDRAGLMDQDWFSLESGQGTIELVSREDSATSRPVLLTEEDLAQLQLARAAMAAGLQILLAESGLKLEQIEGVLLAGAFGNYMNHDDAAIVGLFPPSLRDKARGIGNAAGAGAVRALVNLDERSRAQEIANSVRYIELSARPDFNERFVACLSLPELPERMGHG